MGIFDSFKKKPDESASQAKSGPPSGPPAAASGKWQVGDKIQNRYEIHHVRGGPGKSGMGIVYLCYNREFRKPVAVKTLQDRFLKDRATVERFLWEAEVWVRLEKHYNIVQAQYVGEIDGRPCIFLEYVVGDEQYGADLSGWIWGGALTLRLILNFSIQFCHGMIHADGKFREMGKLFVHRDIKPSNIMITRDKVVKITDFGLVKAFAESGDDILSTVYGDESHRKFGLSKSGNICGTPPYMSPEQCRGKSDIDARSDIYSFGCVLYEMVTRRFVFDVRTVEEFIYHHLMTIPKPPNVQEELNKVIMKCLEKEPDKRYQDFRELSYVLSDLYYRLTGGVVKQPEASKLEVGEIWNKALSLDNLGLGEEAYNSLFQALKAEPNNPGLHTNLGSFYDLLGRLDDAIAEYKEALRLDPNDAQTHANLGWVYEEGHGTLDDAIEEYEECVRLDPNHTDAHWRLGILYHEQGEVDCSIFNKAISEFKEVARLDPDYSGAHDRLAMAYEAQGRLDEAIIENKEALRLYPDDDASSDALESIYEKQSQLEGSIGELVELLRLDPNNAAGHYALARAFHQQGKLDDAIIEFKVLLRLCPNDAAAHCALGDAFYTQRELDAAVREYKEALRLNPNDANAHFCLGRSYHDQGKIDDAVREYKETLKLNPNDANARYYSGKAHHDQGKLDSAIAEYKEALRLNPNDFKANYNLGKAYHKQGKFEEAIVFYQEFIKLAPLVPSRMVIDIEENVRRLKQRT